MIAACYRSGEIVFERRAPEGTMPLGRGRMRQLRPIVEVLARRSYTPGVILVPGVPEADSDDDAMVAVRRFRENVRRRLCGELGWAR